MAFQYWLVTDELSVWSKFIMCDSFAAQTQSRRSPLGSLTDYSCLRHAARGCHRPWVACRKAGAQGSTLFSLRKRTVEERCMLSFVGNVQIFLSPVETGDVARFVASHFWRKKSSDLAMKLAALKHSPVARTHVTRPIKRRVRPSMALIGSHHRSFD